jgi:hypothetical protein
MQNNTDRSRGRVEALRRVADDHGLSPNAGTDAGEALGVDLASPELLRASPSVCSPTRRSPSCRSKSSTSTAVPD